MGPMLRAVNEIARRLKSKYPHVAVDTLAYQYTQPAPNITRPEPNVIIRLCDISSNMGAPLTDPSNEAFAGISYVSATVQITLSSEWKIFNE